MQAGSGIAALNWLNGNHRNKDTLVQDKIAAVAGKLSDPGAASLVVGEGANRHDILIVKWQGKVHVFENACPHNGTPLDTFPDQFFNADGTRLLCSTHGAEFDPDTGLCLKGPCKGKFLNTYT